MALEEGAVFAGRYRVLHCIAAGGMGEVYEVIHLETERHRALKVMLPHILGSAELRERFKREARLAAYIESEFIVDVFDAGVDEHTEMPFLVMELLRGEELGKRLERLGRFSPEEVVTYLHQTALALDKTHKASIVHRDLKPGNLFLTEREHGEPRVKVLDFGIAKLIADGATGAGATCSVGTPLYMSPEQFLTEGRISPAADLYALGMIAYTFLSGEPYWAMEMAKGWSIFAFANVAAKGPRDPPSARAAVRGVVLPPAFDRWFTKATAVNPAHRFSTASTAVSALAESLEVPLPQAFASSSRSRAQAPSAGGGGSMPTQLNAAVTRTLSRRGAGSLVAVVALLSLAGTVVSFSLFWPPPQAARPAVQALEATKGSPPPEETVASTPPPVAPPVSITPPTSTRPPVPVTPPTSTRAVSAPKLAAPTTIARSPKKYTRD